MRLKKLFPLGGVLVFATTACLDEPPEGEISANCEDGKCDGWDEAEPEEDIGDEREEWIVLQTHLHTTGMHECSKNPLDPGPLPEGECYNSEGLSSFLEQALDYGATDMLITDHNNIDAWFDPAFHPMVSGDGSRLATPLRGVEWTTGSGHLNFFFPRQVVASNADAFQGGWMYTDGSGVDVEDIQTYVDVIDAVHDLGGMVIINHPRLRIHTFEEATYGADAVEVGVKRKLSGALQEPTATRRWWQRRLVEGDRITGIAGADHHWGAGDIPLVDEPLFGVAINLLRIDTGLPNVDAASANNEPAHTIDVRSDLVADTIARGSVMVVREIWSPRVYIGADTDGDGRFHDARAGDCLQTEADLDLPIRVRVTGADVLADGHYNASFWTAASDEDPWFEVELDPEDGFDPSDHYTIDPQDPFAITLSLPVEGRQFFRVVLEEDIFGPLNEMETVTNPIYVGSWGDECEGSAIVR